MIETPPPAIARVMLATSEHFGVPDLTAKGRSKTLALARHVALYICRAYVRTGGVGPSYPELARWFGMANHTSAMHGVQVVEKRKVQLEDTIRAIRIAIGRGIIREVQPMPIGWVRKCSSGESCS